MFVFLTYLNASILKYVKCFFLNYYFENNDILHFLQCWHKDMMDATEKGMNLLINWQNTCDKSWYQEQNSIVPKFKKYTFWLIG